MDNGDGLVFFVVVVVVFSFVFVFHFFFVFSFFFFYTFRIRLQGWFATNKYIRHHKLIPKADDNRLVQCMYGEHMIR